MRFTTVGTLAVSFAAQALATGWSIDASSYSCPSNTNNNCTDTQKSGYDWSGLKPGAFDTYGSNKFSGWSCSNSFGKRDSVSKRNFQNKCITAGLHDHPVISCHDNDAMSIEHMQVSSTHDTDLECHYGMPDGSTCKEYHSCRSGGSILQNTQCGGATSVTFKPGENSPPGCSIGVHSVGFNCGTASSTVAYSTPTPTAYQSTSVSIAQTTPPAYQSTSDIASTSETTSSTVSIPTETSSSVVSAVSSTTAQTYSVPAYSTQSLSSAASASSSSSTPVVVPSSSEVSPASSSSVPVAYTTSSPPAYGGSTSVPSSSSTAGPLSSSSGPVPYSSATIQTYSGSIPAASSSSSEVSPGTSSTPAVYSTTQASTASAPGTSSSSEVSPESSSKPVSYTTSTVYSTTVSTTTSCAGGSSSCAEQSTVYITNTVAVSTTVCPVTESKAGYSSSSAVSPASSSPASSYVAPTTTPNSSGAAPTSSAPAPYSSSSETSAAPTSASSYPSSSEASPVKSTEASSSAPSAYPTPNAPGLLPKCLNTWMYETGCKDNTDASCYCKDEQFVKHVMGCIASWSGSNSDTSNAASYFQGICAQYIPQNPALITACPKTTPASSTSEVAPVSTGPPTTATITRYSTKEVTVTSCAAEVSNCPARSTTIVTTSVPIATTVIVQSAPITTAPATTPANTPVGPVTTIVYSSTVVVPCTYSTGVSAGYTIPSSSLTTQLVTTVTVPQVQFTTATMTQPGQTSTVSIGLGNGTPPPYTVDSAAPTAGPTSYGTIATAYTSNTPVATTSPIPYTGAAIILSGSKITGAIFGAAAVLLAL